uniref:Fibronectin type-III domain-containing protein n=1 Tax=Meleagris gallopavo TaxID=9103 RepID=A0A803Y220_MELGA
MYQSRECRPCPLLGQPLFCLISSHVFGAEKCMKPQLGPRIHFVPDQEFYDVNTSLMLTCPNGYWPSAMEIICVKPRPHEGLPAPQNIWFMKNSTGLWPLAVGYMRCVGKCQKPQWDPRILFVPDKGSYDLNETVILTCPVGYWLSHTEVSCMKQNPRQGSTASQSIWHEKNGRGRWQPVEKNMICVEVFQVVPGSLVVSSTSIKLNWTCRFPDACQHVQATCRLAGPSSPPCKAEKVTEQEILHGQKGTFACPPLQPFTVYSITISVPPSTILFTQHLRTKATVPQKPEQLQLDASTGTLRWKALPSCRGEIIGYQLNFTARRAHDGTFLNFQQVTVNHSVTQYTPPPQSPGSKYTVTVQGLTAAGAGDASSLEFQAYISVSGQFLGSWPWTAVTVVVVLSVMVTLSVVIVWFVLSRRRKAVPTKAEEDHYVELQPYENSDIYSVIKGRSLSEEEAGAGGQDREPTSLHLPILESSGDSPSSVRVEKMGRTSLGQW